MNRQVVVLEEAAVDIEQAIRFYDSIEAGAGDWFRDSLLGDIRRLAFFFGEHRQHMGCCRALASHFPYAIYYRDRGELRQVVAVLDLRRDPAGLRDDLEGRNVG